VNIDYHVEVDHHYYSVPYQLVHETADVRISATTVEFFVRSRRVASHVPLVRVIQGHDGPPPTCQRHTAAISSGRPGA
jgi:transposase